MGVMGRRVRAADGWLTVSEFVELVGIHGIGKNAVDNARALLAEFSFEGEDSALEVERDGRPLTELGFRAVPTAGSTMGGLVEIRVRDQERFDAMVERMRAAAAFAELEKRAGGEGSITSFSDLMRSPAVIDMIRAENLAKAEQAAGFPAAVFKPQAMVPKVGIDFSKLAGKTK